MEKESRADDPQILVPRLQETYISSGAGLLTISLSRVITARALLAFLFICLTGTVACNALSLSLSQERKRELPPKLVQFHVSLISQRVSPVLRHFPAEERRKWENAFNCMNKEYRYLDYRIEEIHYGAEAKEATVFVKVTGQALDSLYSEEFTWEEKWESRDKSWFLDPTPELIQRILGTCYPGPDDKKNQADSSTEL